MRDILFRAKRKNWKELPKEQWWVEGYYFCMVHTDCRHTHHFIIPLGVSLEKGTPIEKIQVEIYVNTLCQYTGLTDKSGQKIWENDIVEAWSEGKRAIGNIKQRIDGAWIMYPAWQHEVMWYLLPNDDGSTTVKVIGNIFYNPDLLNE